MSVVMWNMDAAGGSMSVVRWNKDAAGGSTWVLMRVSCLGAVAGGSGLGIGDP